MQPLAHTINVVYLTCCYFYDRFKTISLSGVILVSSNNGWCIAEGNNFHDSVNVVRTYSINCYHVHMRGGTRNNYGVFAYTKYFPYANLASRMSVVCAHAVIQISHDM